MTTSIESLLQHQQSSQLLTFTEQREPLADQSLLTDHLRSFCKLCANSVWHLRTYLLHCWTVGTQRLKIILEFI